MRVLVLGGNRYIGLHLLFELARQGHDVTVMNSHVAPMPDGCRRLHGDRQRPGVLAEVLGPHRDEFDVVFDNTAYQVHDLEPLVELFRGRVRQFVFTSSAAVYRRSFVQPVQEQFRRHDPADTDPRKGYGVGKVRCEDHLLGLHAAEGFPATVLRVSHTLGPMSPLVTRDPIFFARLEQGRPILVPGDGFAFVHLVHVADVAGLMCALIGNDTVVGQAYNVTGDEVTSIDGAVHLMARAAGVGANIVHVPMELARRCHPPLVHWGEAIMGGTVLSNTKARRDIAYVPRFGLEDGYRDSYRWFDEGGRDRYEYDFSADEAVLAQLAR